MSTVSCILSSVRRTPVSGCGKGGVRRDVRFDSSCVRYFLLLSNRYSVIARKYSQYRNCDRLHEWDTYLSGLGVEDEAGDGDRSGLFHEPNLGHLSNK